MSGDVRQRWTEKGTRTSPAFYIRSTSILADPQQPGQSQGLADRMGNDGRACFLTWRSPGASASRGSWPSSAIVEGHLISQSATAGFLCKGKYHRSPPAFWPRPWVSARRTSVAGTVAKRSPDGSYVRAPLVSLQESSTLRSWCDKTRLSMCCRRVSDAGGIP